VVTAFACRGRGDLAEVLGKVERFRTLDGKPRSRCDENARKARECGVACCRVVAIPRRIAHLRPLVGTHHDRVVARRDVGDEPGVGDDHVQPWARFREPFERGQPCRERALRGRVLAERIARDREIEVVELRGANRGFGDRGVGDGRWIERPGIDASSFARVHRFVRVHRAWRAVTTASAVTRPAP
jgi:hypothetical protein